jgi:N-acetylmuramoyl-L-alanine amidase
MVQKIFALTLCSTLAAHTIVLDPGHGGIFSGAVSPHLKLVEKAITLDIATHLQTILQKHGCSTLLTRTSDTHLAPLLKDDLQARTALANSVQADLFISIHCNSGSPKTHGFELYIPWRTEPDIESYGIALFLHHALAHHITPLWAGNLGNLNSTDRGIRQAKFTLFQGCNCPCVLIEIAYLSHPASEALLAQASYRQFLANVLYSGIVAWRGFISEPEIGQ